MMTIQTAIQCADNAFGLPLQGFRNQLVGPRRRQAQAQQFLPGVIGIELTQPYLDEQFLYIVGGRQCLVRSARALLTSLFGASDWRRLARGPVAIRPRRAAAKRSQFIDADRARREIGGQFLFLNLRIVDGGRFHFHRQMRPKLRRQLTSVLFRQQVQERLHRQRGELQQTGVERGIAAAIGQPRRDSRHAARRDR